MSLSADGNTVAIGAPSHDGTGEDSGTVRIFDFNGTSWVQRGNNINGESVGDNAGKTVSLSMDGNIVAIGSPNYKFKGPTVGQVRVFNWNGTSWVKIGSDINGKFPGESFGGALSLNEEGTIVAIGAQFRPDDGIDGVGVIGVFQFDGTNWNQMGSYIKGLGVNSNWGASVDLSADGNTFIGGAFRQGTKDKGFARIYTFNGSYWAQKGTSIVGEADGDYSGYAVSISNNGEVVAVGAPENDGNGNTAGHARIFNFVEDWVQLGADIDGQMAGDRLGLALILSANGETIAIGAPSHTGNGNGSGQVRIFRFDQQLGMKGNLFNSISIYPNPSNGNFTLDLGGEYSGVTVMITNILGQNISSETYASARTIEQEINAPAGVYFVKVSTVKEGSGTIRIIKN